MSRFTMEEENPGLCIEHVYCNDFGSGLSTRLLGHKKSGPRNASWAALIVLFPVWTGWYATF